MSKRSLLTACDHAVMSGEVTGNVALACTGHGWVLADTQDRNRHLDSMLLELCSKAGADAGTIAEAGVNHMHPCSVMCSLAVAMASESTFSKGTLSVPMLLVTVQLLLAI